MPKFDLSVEVPERECTRCLKRAPCKIKAFVTGWGNVPSEFADPEGWQRIQIMKTNGFFCGDCVMSFAEWLEKGGAALKVIWGKT